MSLTDQTKVHLVQAWPTLVIFCKRPTLQQGKQRLAQTIGATPALAIAKAMLACALEDARSWQGPVVLAVSSSTDMSWAGRLMDEKAEVMCQGRGNLGERLHTIDNQLRAQGHQSIVYIGTDAPALLPMHFQSICQLLSEHSFAFSKANDGGVTIMGGNQPWPPLTELPWSTSQLGDALIQASQATGSVGLCEKSYDIDIESDLIHLLSDLQMDKRKARQFLLNVIKETGVVDVFTL
jgi:glycosyltransferase A (GT-A) superfamily protein (DUF2064 family)